MSRFLNEISNPTSTLSGLGTGSGLGAGSVSPAVLGGLLLILVYFATAATGGRAQEAKG